MEPTMGHRDLEVPPSGRGERLDAWLARALGKPRARAAALIDSGAALVDGAPRAKGHRLRGGERVAVGELEPSREPVPSSPEAPVAWENDDLLVVDKPAGIV